MTHCHADHDAGTFQKVLLDGQVNIISTRCEPQQQFEERVGSSQPFSLPKCSKALSVQIRDRPFGWCQGCPTEWIATLCPKPKPTRSKDQSLCIN